MGTIVAVAAGRLVFTGVCLSIGFGIGVWIKSKAVKLAAIARRKIAELAYKVTRAIIRSKYNMTGPEFAQFADTL